MIPNINRYKPDNDGRLWPASDGEYVLYADHVAALALIPGEPVAWAAMQDGKVFANEISADRNAVAWADDHHYLTVCPLYAAPAPLPVAVKDETEVKSWPLWNETARELAAENERLRGLVERAAMIAEEHAAADLHLRDKAKEAKDATGVFVHAAEAATGKAIAAAIRSALSSPVGGMEETFTRAQMLAEVERRVERALLAKRLVGEARAEFEAENATPASDIAALREERDPLFWMRLGARAMRLSARAACGNHWESSQEDAMTSDGLSKLAKEKLYAEANASEEISRVISEKCEDSALGYASYMGDEADRKLLADQGVTSDWLYRHHTGEPSRKELSNGSALQHVAKGERGQ